MSESRKQTLVRFTPEAFNQYDDEVTKVIKEDTGTDEFIAQPSYPPIYHPPPLTTEAINMLKSFTGVEVVILDDEE
ncbi:hypothetical protein ETB97_009876 [Aspergillus alliaceus]|uniref:Uncharacterized protein n=1 Tax=Petromyces alliaceus TaxID=209559 RepID=A0A5N6G8L0_PETAA|nr:uncharacterized protein BDW43DRAFT_305658 [Aspergillus alliaceus]KAB8238751.1 hypothetical protein BDW43DRAFT_305658 [Aspergillus alliaceus]KAF5866719.1 hypothetical protein ETB97_009876 [Aspergillus burnettii]